MIKNKLLKLMVPYFIFSLILTMFFCLLKFISKGEFINSFYEYLIKIVTLKGVESLWFIPCLFITEIVFYLLINKCKDKVVYIISVVIYFVSANLGYNREYLFFSVLFKSGVAILFFAFGHMIYRYIKEERFSNFFIILINIINLMLFKLNGFVGLGAFILNNVFLYAILGIMGSMGIILFVQKMENKSFKLLNFLGSNTIVILCTNNIIIEVIRLLDYKIFGNILINLKLCGSFIFCAIIIILEIITILVCNKYLYYLFGKKKSI